MELQKLIDSYLESKETRKRDGKFHISELAKSKRILYDEFTDDDAAEKPAPQLKRIFENGNFVHQRYYKYFAEMGILRAVEIKAIDDDLFAGTADCILSDNSGVIWLVDIKSCNSWVFKKLKEMKPAHKLQILGYMHFMNINQGMVLYENKDDQDIKIFKIFLDDENSSLIKQKIASLRILKSDYIDKGIEPPEDAIILEDMHAI